MANGTSATSTGSSSSRTSSSTLQERRPLSKVGSMLRNSVEGLFAKVPVLNPNLPLTVYYHDTAKLKEIIKELEGVGSDGDTTELIDRMHQAQCSVLESLDTIYDAGGFHREPRDYRAKFPAQVRDELQSNFWETLLFAAELISDGRVLENREEATIAIQPAATGLCEAFEACSRVLRAQAKRNPSNLNTTKIAETLRHFEMSWIHFEYLYVHAVMPCKTLLQYQEKLDMTVAFSEAVIRGLDRRHITADQMEYYDPQVMFTIPRLAVLSCVLLNPNTVEGYSLLKPYTQQLDSIKSKIKRLDSIGIMNLERELAATDDTDIKRSDTIQDLFVAISDISDRMQSGDSSQDYRDIMSTLFKMYEDCSITHPLKDEPDEEEVEEITHLPLTSAPPTMSVERQMSHDARETFRKMSQEFTNMGTASRDQLVRTLSIDVDAFDGVEGVERSFQFTQSERDMSTLSSAHTPSNIRCSICERTFSITRRKHTCTECKLLLCSDCSNQVNSWHDARMCRKCASLPTTHQSMPILFSELSLAVAEPHPIQRKADSYPKTEDTPGGVHTAASEHKNEDTSFLFPALPEGDGTPEVILSSAGEYRLLNCGDE